MRLEIPGYWTLEIENILLDYNGTVARDGRIREEVRGLWKRLSERFRVYILTADTHGTARQECEGLGVTVSAFPSGGAAPEKEKKALELGADTCACIGNGRNDCAMLRRGALSVAVMDKEGVYAGLLSCCDLCVRSSEEALELFLYPDRIVAGLRG